MGNLEVTSPDVFHAIADATRREILRQLAGGERAVNEIASHFEISRPAISKHLRVLAEARLVTEERRGRNNLYRLNPEPLKQVDRWLEQYRSFWSANLASLKRHVEQGGKHGDSRTAK